MRHTLNEMLNIVIGVAAAALIVALAAWAYPLGAETIWRIGYVAMAAVAGMGIPALRIAWDADRGSAGRGHADG